MTHANLIPVSVLTGFLGSGKTTVLNRVLKQPGMENTAVIVNEFGEVGIDHLLVETALEGAMLLESGCVCCSVRGDLVDTLEMLGDDMQFGFRKQMVDIRDSARGRVFDGNHRQLGVASAHGGEYILKGRAG